MARPREFDAERVLERVMLEFWNRGYEACSIADLCAATGLSRSSLYAGFGGKRALLLRSLERYSDLGSVRLNAYFVRHRSVRVALRALLHDFIDSIIQGPGRRGCFIGNCAVELARHDRSTRLQVNRSLQRIESTLRTRLEHARSRGELASSTNTRALARFFMSGLQGLRLVGKAEADRATLTDIATSMLRVFDAAPVH